MDIRRAALQAIFAVVGCDRAAIRLFDKKKTMRFAESRRLSARYRKAASDYAPWKRGARAPRADYISKVDSSEIPRPLKAALKAEGIRALAHFPLMSGAELIGCLTTYYDAPHIFTEEERNLSMAIAGQLALGLERKRAEKALQESEELHRAFVNQSAVGMVRTDLRGRLIFANRTFCKMLGYSVRELIGKKIRDITHHDDFGENVRLFRRLVSHGIPYQLEKRYLRKDGSFFWATTSASPIRDAERRTRSAAAVVLNIDDQRSARTILETAKVDLEARVLSETGLRKRLEGEILEISEREQRRLGQDLHDSLCQHLTATAYMTQVVARRLQDHRVVEVKDIERIAALINEGVTEARTIARGLHPVELDAAGISTALHSLLHRQSNLPYRLDIDEEMEIPDPTIASHLYRIAREAVINANKHSRARELFVRMRQLPRQFELSVTDDGVGLPKKTPDGTGMGFHIMHYRARTIGARLEITNVKPHGVRVACYLPRV